MMTLDMSKVDVNAMGEDELRTLCEQLIEERAMAGDRLVDLYHPELGSEWFDDGEIGQAILHARADTLKEAMALIAPPEGADGDAAVALTIAGRALGAERQALLNRANTAAITLEARKNRASLKLAPKPAEAG